MTVEQELGQFYKKTRKKRNYTQRDAASPYCDHTLISRFEKGETMLGADKLLLAINGLDMTPTEFFVSHGNYQPNRLQIFDQKMGRYIMAGDTEGLKNLLKPNSKVKEDKLFNILIKCAIYDTSDEMLLTKADRKYAEDYFEKIEQWTLFDVSFFAKCLEALDDDEAFDIGQDILENHKFSSILSGNAEVTKKTLVNLYVHLICHGSHRRAERLKDKFDDFLTEWDMEEKILLHFFENVSFYKQGKSPELLKEIQDDIQTLEKFGATGMAKRIAMFIEKYC
ncbi:transcriptional regulator [Lactococcus hodotermopsidis]|uniref:Transcriptional regulator n=1 Tax=Pseudolactococcus hodotermopsidis TaxID=2709157 RepID=A0A6A0BF71_9LACT|nr:Rgg/GadR/MutR family transcriptional regulator [Lactococcus hodotermopsidis]GFH43426.1 transcriptional regulator [Lactococcus hodotermopsidis]